MGQRIKAVYGKAAPFVKWAGGKRSISGRYLPVSSRPYLISTPR